ncbi:MAG: hypothetical protein AABZ15_14715 [Nitrospirota bacterium]
MNILLHCIPGYMPFFLEVIRRSQMQKLPVDWSILNYSNGEGLLAEARTLVGNDRVLDLQEKLTAFMQQDRVELDLLKDLPTPVYQCIATSKVIKGHHSIPTKDRRYQLQLIIGTYVAYKDFLLAHRPDFVFFPIIESYDSMVLYHLCSELGIQRVIYGHARNLGVSYFTDAIGEPLPPYTLHEPLSESDRLRAGEFLQAFRTDYRPPFEIKLHPSEEEVINTSRLDLNLFQKAVKFLRIRLGGFEPHVVDRYTLLHNLKIHFHPLTMAYRRMKGELLYRRLFDITTVDELPNRFIYLPLQYTPETSINTPAPFFIDQSRVIDLVLSAMPPDHVLVVKEHPAMRGERALSFYREQKRKAGVVLADYAISNIEVVKRAALTVSVTGTSCLEAFLLGRPSLHISRAFFSDWIHTFDSFWNFGAQMREALRSGNVPEEKIIDFVGRTLRIGAHFYVYSAGGGPYGRRDLLMNTKNIDAFLAALVRHLERLDGSAASREVS